MSSFEIDADTWKRLNGLLDDALELSPRERKQWLEKLRPEDEPLRPRLEALLTHAESKPDAFLETLPKLHLEQTESPADQSGSYSRKGEAIGPYQLVRLLAKGGMGSVWLAQRTDGMIERDVALKLPRGIWSAPELSQRMAREREILASLNHPHIAQLFDAGLTDDGQPYLALEYIEGIPIVDYANAKALDTRARLRLFLQVTQAVAHAHARLVVHRDIKPSNILVTEDGRAQLLDFGIAKILDDGRAEESELTRLSGRALTLAYASPEQVLGDPIGVGSDVYSLGVVLFELLTGKRPYEPERDTRRAFEDAILKAEPARPSELNETAAVSKVLKGDLDTILLKSLRKPTAERYATVNAFADDIERFLAGHPVLAQPDSPGYRARRFVSRNRIAVGAASFLFVLVSAFSVITLIQSYRVAEERDRARLEADRAAKVSLLVADLFKLADPAPQKGQTIAALELLDRGTQRIETELRGDPSTQAALYNAVGRVYGNLSQHDKAVTVLERSVELGRSNGSVNLDLAATLHELGEQQEAQNHYEDAERSFDDAIRLRRELGAAKSELAASLEWLGRVRSAAGKHEDAVAPLREAVELYRELPDEPENQMTALSELGLALHRRGGLEEAEELYREAVKLGRELPNDSPAKLSAILNLARMIERYDEDPKTAEPLYSEALTVARSLYSGDHQDVATALIERARGLRALDRMDDAEALAREASAMYRRIYGADNREVILAEQTLADILQRTGKVSEAELILRTGLESARSLFGASHPIKMGVERRLASVLEKQEKFDEARRLRENNLEAALGLSEQGVYAAISLTGFASHHKASGDFALAETYLRRALEVREAIHASGHWRVFQARAELGHCLSESGQFEDAETLLITSYDSLLQTRGRHSQATEVAREFVVELYENWGKPREANKYRRAKEVD